MKKTLSKTAGTIIPLLLGIAIVYYQYTTTSAEDMKSITNSLLQADYFYVGLALFFAFCSHWSRTYRWKFALHHLGYHPSFLNKFLAIGVSYFMNLTIPRSGEISRAAILKKYENVPFDKAFGTIVAERIVDLLLFFCFVVAGVLFEFEKITTFFYTKIPFQKLLVIGVFLLLFLVFSIYMWFFTKWEIVLLLKQKLAGLSEGVMSIMRMKNRGSFFFHSLFIWFCYFMMFYLNIYALPETTAVSFEVILIGFIFGSLAIGFTNGGLGAYPYAITQLFLLYQISDAVGKSFGWLVWTSQTLFTIFLGLISFLLLPIVNKQK